MFENASSGSPSSSVACRWMASASSCFPLRARHAPRRPQEPVWSSPSVGFSRRASCEEAPIHQVHCMQCSSKNVIWKTSAVARRQNLRRSSITRIHGLESVLPRFDLSLFASVLGALKEGLKLVGVARFELVHFCDQSTYRPRDGPCSAAPLKFCKPGSLTLAHFNFVDH